MVEEGKVIELENLGVPTHPIKLRIFRFTGN